MAEDPDNVTTAADLLRHAIAAGEALLAARDQTGTGFITGTRTESAPPWNPAAADAVFTPHAEIRALEDEARRALGLEPVNRSGSDADTDAALAALPQLVPALPQEHAARITGRLEACAKLGMNLPAVNGLPRWMTFRLDDGSRPPDCPYCRKPSLRAYETHGVIACLYPYCPAARDGPRPWAAVCRSQGKLSWQWPDGTVQP